MTDSKIPPMPGIPGIPSSKNVKKILSNPDFHQTKKDYFRKIRDTLLALVVALPKGRDKEIVMRFIGYINPGKYHDPSRLPVESRTDGKSKFEGKSECLFAKVGKMIQAYWVFCKDGGSTDTTQIDTELDAVKQVAEKGLSAYKIEGSAKKGFELILK